MKVALVHDYLREYGGAERVLKELCDIYPKAPIYTAFRVKDSTAGKEFQDKKIIECQLAPILKIGKLYSPLRFLAPLIWKSFNLRDYDLVITSCSWYISRGFRISPKTKVVAYCHTPPRWLYGYETSVGVTKFWPVKIYSFIVGHFMRMYDFASAQTVKFWIANSENVKERIKKYYRKDSVVIYPPVDVEKIITVSKELKNKKNGGYFLIVSRLVGAKGIDEAVKAFSRLGDGYKLKIVGEASGYSQVESRIRTNEYKNVELVGRVDDDTLFRLYAKAWGFIALARDEDFGMTPVESQAAGTPVIAFRGGGFRASVVDGGSGILIDDTDEKTIRNAIIRFNKTKWNKEKIQALAMKFSRKRFEKEIRNYIASLK